MSNETERDRGYIPRRPAIKPGKCDVRLTAEEDRMLNTIAERNGVSRSEVVRKALKDFYKFNGGDGE